MNGSTRRNVLDRRNLTTVLIQIVTIALTLGALLWPFTTRLESRLTALEIKLERLQADVREVTVRALQRYWGQ